MLATTTRARGALFRNLALTLCLMVAPFAARAEEAAPAGDVEMGSTPAAAEPPAPNSGRISLSVGNDFTTAYFLRGILQERDGFIWQPYGGITFKLADELGYGVIKNFAFSLSTWNSIQSNQTFAQSSPKNWYEADIIAGFSMTLWDYVNTNISYVAFTYPNGAFSTAQELDWTIGFNDAEFLGPFALNPSVLWVFEVDNVSFGDLDREGIYVQPGVKPSVTLFQEADYPVTLALPLSVGLSVSNYYEESGGGLDQTFGFFDAGLVASVPLSFIPSDYGTWSASASFDVLALSATLARANRGDGTFFVGKGGISFAY